MRRSVARVYGAGAYVGALASLVWLVLFVQDWAVPRSVERGPEAGLGQALVIDFAVLMLFGFQHMVMARAGFKALVTERIPEAIERSTYVLASTLALLVVLYCWHPIPFALYDLRETWAAPLLHALSIGGFLLMLGSTFVIDHADLFGLKQVNRYARGIPYDPPELVEVSLYRYLRHPLYLGWLIFFWATPHMSAGHLLLAGWMTGFVLVAIPLEERDLAATLGGAYRRYRERVPRFLPRAPRAPQVPTEG